jgi:hypothetical protein
VVATRPCRTPILDPLCGISIFVLYAWIDAVQLHSFGSVVASWSDAAFAAKRTLRSIWHSAALKYVEPYLNVLHKAEDKLRENCNSCLDFLRECLRYGPTEVLACASFISYPYFSRSRASQDIKDQAASLREERVDIVAYTPIQTRGSFLRNPIATLARRGTATEQGIRMFNSVHEETLSSLQKSDHGLDILLGYLITCVTQMDAHSTSPGFSIKCLHALSRNWLKKRDVLRYLLMVLPVEGGPTTFPTLPESP